MITSLDSSVIIDVLIDDPKWKATSLAALRKARSEGQLIISDFTLAEINPALSGHSIRDFMKQWELSHVPCSLEAVIYAGKCFSNYLSRGGKNGRIVADFLIAAHAHFHADRLLTRDFGFQRGYFRSIKIWKI